MKFALFAILFLAIDGLDGCSPAPQTRGDQVLLKAFENRTTDLEIEGEGTVIRVLADDNAGGRHQRFVLRLRSEQTLLMAHNIDLAARIDHLKVGDKVLFKGEYRWNAEGGVVHWTHRDPEGSHPDGWIKHGGHTYQ
jgi:hypothetical protein